MFLIPVFFRAELVGPEQHFSPSAHKPARVADDWARAGLPVHFVAPDPVTRDELRLAHEPRFVDEVFAGTEPNGFGNCDPAVAASTLFTCGAMLAAAREAIGNRRVAVAPVSGFHHANHGFAQAFCTFNGLMVAAVALRRSGAARRVGILDCDHHYGDGTDDIIGELGADWVAHESVARRYRRPEHAARFFAGLADTVRSFAGCDVLLYQAGADPHVDDPLGGWLTTAELAERDRIVFATAAAIGLPVAWNLAGGYQRDADGGISAVLEIHRNTLLACAGVHCDAAADTPAARTLGGVAGAAMRPQRNRLTP